jgi:YjbE family integral membrane protein
MQPLFWAALGNIILVNIVLSGDNAVVIALAARSLPPAQQKKAIFWGSGAAIVMRIILTIFASAMLTKPYLKLVGAMLLFYIGVQLLMEGDEDDNGEVKEVSTMGTAIRTILIADLVMSLDNVLGVAAAAKGNNVLLILGLAISIPLIIFGSTVILKLMEKFPIIITLGAALLGYLAGDMLVSDPKMVEWFPSLHHAQELTIIPGSLEVSLAGLLAAVMVVVVGKILEAKARHKVPERPVV